MGCEGNIGAGELVLPRALLRRLCRRELREERLEDMEVEELPLEDCGVEGVLEPVVLGLGAFWREGEGDSSCVRIGWTSSSSVVTSTSSSSVPSACCTVSSFACAEMALRDERYWS